MRLLQIHIICRVVESTDTNTPLRYLFLWSTRYYTIFWVLIRLSHDIRDISHLVKYAHKLQELQHYCEIREKSVQYM